MYKDKSRRFVTISRGRLHSVTYLRVHRVHRTSNESFPCTQASVERLKKLVKEGKLVFTHSSFYVDRIALFYDIACICPRCKEVPLKEPFVRYCSLSRMDNETYICHACGDEEAGLDAGLLYITDDMLERDLAIPKTGESNG